MRSSREGAAQYPAVKTGRPGSGGERWEALPVGLTGLTSNAPARRTPEAVLLSYQKYSELNIIHIDMSVTEDVRVCGDLAHAWGMDTGTTPPRSGGEPVPYNLKWLMVFERQSGGAWKCLFEMWNENNPPANMH
jgi:ketosteroid isomerase-like protein